MHNVRRRARDLAWNGQHGQMSSRYNRFKAMYRSSMRPASSYQLEEPIQIVSQIYEVPAWSNETQSQPPNLPPGSIVERPGVVHTLSHTSDQASSKNERVAALRIAPENLHLDHAIMSARRSRRGLGHVGQALIDGLGVIFNKLRWVCLQYSIKSGSILTVVNQDIGGFVAAVPNCIPVLGDYLNLLLVTVPAGIAINYTPTSRIAVFFVNFVAVIPSNKILGLAMDELEVRLEGSSLLLGLISCTFGNAVQLIQSILLLKNRQLDVLRVSLLGTILTNLLFLTGLSFLLGGMRYHDQVFDKNLTQTITMLLFLAILSLVVPTASHYLSKIDEAGILAQSRGTAVVIMISYGLWLLFDLKTHKPVEALYQNTMNQERRKERNRRGLDRPQGDSRASGDITRISPPLPLDDVENVDSKPRLTVSVAIIVVLAATAVIAINTEFATDSVQSLTEKSVSSSFVGLVILPIISLDTGAIKCALHDNMDLSIALSLGRCMQNALMVVPLTILLAWCMGIDDMSLQFDAFTITTLFISMVILGYVVQEGKSNWLTGALLVKIFVIIALASWWMP